MGVREEVRSALQSHLWAKSGGQRDSLDREGEDMEGEGPAFRGPGTEERAPCCLETGREEH